jgi:hypothetical protein
MERLSMAMEPSIFSITERGSPMNWNDKILELKLQISIKRAQRFNHTSWVTEEQVLQYFRTKSQFAPTIERLRAKKMISEGRSYGVPRWTWNGRWI